MHRTKCWLFNTCTNVHLYIKTKINTKTCTCSLCLYIILLNMTGKYQICFIYHSVSHVCARLTLNTVLYTRTISFPFFTYKIKRKISFCEQFQCDLWGIFQPERHTLTHVHKEWKIIIKLFFHFRGTHALFIKNKTYQVISVCFEITIQCVKY